jgi:hypothetical protein
MGPTRMSFDFLFTILGSRSDRLASGGHDLNFDLVWPSSAIPDDFFPSNETLYGASSLLMRTHSALIFLSFINRLYCKYTFRSYSVPF